MGMLGERRHAGEEELMIQGGQDEEEKEIWDSVPRLLTGHVGCVCLIILCKPRWSFWKNLFLIDWNYVICNIASDGFLCP